MSSRMWDSLRRHDASMVLHQCGVQVGYRSHLSSLNAIMAPCRNDGYMLKWGKHHATGHGKPPREESLAGHKYAGVLAWRTCMA
jgi:hypothetical protein